MIERTFIVRTERGLHMRPSQILQAVAAQYPCAVTVCAHGTKLNGKSFMHLMTAGFREGDTITYVCDGPEEGACMQRLADIFDRNFEGMF